MSETHLGSLGFEAARDRDEQLEKCLRGLTGKKIRFSLKNNEYTLLVTFTATLTAVHIRESIVEAGHFSTHEFAYQLETDGKIDVFLPVGDFVSLHAGEHGGRKLCYLAFTRYYWTMEEL